MSDARKRAQESQRKNGNSPEDTYPTREIWNDFNPYVKLGKEYRQWLQEKNNEL